MEVRFQLSTPRTDSWVACFPEVRLRASRVIYFQKGDQSASSVIYVPPPPKKKQKKLRLSASSLRWGLTGNWRKLKDSLLGVDDWRRKYILEEADSLFGGRQLKKLKYSPDYWRSWNIHIVTVDNYLVKNKQRKYQVWCYVTTFSITSSIRIVWCQEIVSFVIFVVGVFPLPPFLSFMFLFGYADSFTMYANWCNLWNPFNSLQLHWPVNDLSFLLLKDHQIS